MLAADPYVGDPPAGVELVELEELLRRSDFVVCLCPLTDETRGLLDARRLALLKPTAFLVNVARGPIVDQRALTEALRERRLAGAALDVFEHEPRVAPALLAMPNVVLTPHIGSAEVELRARMADVVVDNILAVLDGRRPPNCVNPEVYG